ncbi:MAG: hypothetical protein GX644_03135 [Limnobacter sp.]|nr:hypothetical protein [Limnobacter sp.]
MAQINLHITPDFERALEALMQGKKIASKSEAIRYAVRETAAPYLAAPRRDFSVLEGLIDRSAAKGDVKPRRPIAELERELDAEMEQALQVPQRRKAASRGKR